MSRQDYFSGNLTDFISELSPDISDKLYSNQYVCQAMLRSMPPLCKQYVLRLLYIDTIVPDKEMVGWIFPNEVTEHKEGIDRLLKLKVFLEGLDREKCSGYKLNPKVQNQLRRVIENGIQSPRIPCAISKPPTKEELEDYAERQWEEVLLLLAKPAIDSKPSKRWLINILTQAGLLISDRYSSLKLTEKGFQFLLVDITSQLWHIVKLYILTNKGAAIIDLISFLLELEFYTTGKAYNVDGLKMQYNVMEELATFGLVKYQNKEKCFIPTKLAMIMAASLSGPSTQKSAKGFIVVETNFKIYGYSTSKLHYQMLNYFARIENQLPNLIVGILTRESSYAAFDCGITAEQIIEFLSKNAHPRTENRESAVPANVIDQLILWQREKNRVDINPACIYTDFPTRGFFERSVKQARETKALLWKHSERKQLVVLQEKDNEMRTFMQANAAPCK